MRKHHLWRKFKWQICLVSMDFRSCLSFQVDLLQSGLALQDWGHIFRLVDSLLVFSWLPMDFDNSFASSFSKEIVFEGFAVSFTGCWLSSVNLKFKPLHFTWLIKFLSFELYLTVIILWSLLWSKEEVWTLEIPVSPQSNLSAYMMNYLIWSILFCLLSWFLILWLNFNFYFSK